MLLKEDYDQFEFLQSVLAQAIGQTVKNELESRGLKPEIVKDLTADITFSIASILDGSSQFEIEGKILEPNITFKIAEDTLLYSEDGSWMHDDVYGWVYDLFE